MQTGDFLQRKLSSAAILVSILVIFSDYLIKQVFFGLAQKIIIE